MGQLRNVTLTIVITTFMALGLIGVTLLVDLLPIPAMHAASSAANVIDQITLKSGFVN